MDHFAGPVALLTTVLIAIGALQGMHRATSVTASVHTVMPYLSGATPQEHALSRFHARWYPLTLVFLAFDVEMLFMYPWTLVVASVGIGAVVEMFLFLAVLMAGVVWAWREGAFRWA